ncbi:MAG: hypothetical protein WCF23_05800, partial [Candidatus Nitrosopolaris sp.]
PLFLVQGKYSKIFAGQRADIDNTCTEYSQRTTQMITCLIWSSLLVAGIRLTNRVNRCNEN